MMEMERMWIICKPFVTYDSFASWILELISQE
jgi:hypothetical protein